MKKVRKVMFLCLPLCLAMVMSGCAKIAATDKVTDKATDKATVAATSAPTVTSAAAPTALSANDLTAGDIRFFMTMDDARTLLGNPKAESEYTQQASGTLYKHWEYEGIWLDFAEKDGAWVLEGFNIERDGLAACKGCKVGQTLDEVLAKLPRQHERDIVNGHIYYSGNADGDQAVPPAAWQSTLDGQTLIMAFPYPNAEVNVDSGSEWMFNLHIIMTLTIQDGKVKSIEGSYSAFAE